MEVKVTDKDLRTQLQLLAERNLNLELSLNAHVRTIQEMDTAHAAETRDQQKNGVGEREGAEAVGAEPTPERSNSPEDSG